MPLTPLPTVAQFRYLAGTTSDLDPVFRALGQAHAVPAQSPLAINASRDLRRACLAWLERPRDPRDGKRPHYVRNLLARANERFKSAVEFNPRYAQDRPTPPIPGLPTLPLGVNVTSGPLVPRVGNAMRGKYAGEMGAPHWTPKVEQRVEYSFAIYRRKGGTLNRTSWAEQILAPSIEDDPEGKYLVDGEIKSQRAGGGGVDDPPAIQDPRIVLEGVTYCTERERAAFRLQIRDGRLYDAGTFYPFDTKNSQVSDYGYGWAMFVLGFDNTLYANAEVRDFFHHSSFFAGGPVQCGGELCVIGGELRFLTAKAGHYRSGRPELYRLLSFLRYHEFDLARILVVPDPKERPYKWYTALDVFNTPDDRPMTLRHTGEPPTLRVPGEPELGA